MLVKRRSSQRYPRAALWCVVCAGMVSGAQAASRRALVLEDGERLESLQVLSVIRNADLGVQSPKDAGLPDFAVPEVLDAGLAEIGGALRASDPVTAPSGAFDFRSVFSSGIDSLVAASRWPATRTLRILDQAPSMVDRQQLAAESLSDATLQLETRWFLSFDLRQVVMTTAATLYGPLREASKDSVRYRADFVYASEPMTGRDPEALLNAWAADGASRLRQVTREGVQETLMLLADDVFTRECGPVPVEKPREEFEARDPRGGGGAAVWHGTTLTQSDHRIRLRHEDGHLFSVPAEYRKPVPVFRQEDFRFEISYRPDDRPCIQVQHPSGDARVWLDPAVELAENDGLTDARVALVLRTVKKHEAELRTAWERVHGARLRVRTEPARH